MLGRGVRLWDGLEGQEADYEIESVSTPSGVTHLTFTPGSVAPDPCRPRAGPANLGAGNVADGGL